MELQKRKPNRLSNYDYSSGGYYFITICTAQKQKILCNVVAPLTPDNQSDIGVGEGLRALPLCKPPKTILTDIGKAVNESINYINENYSNTKVDKYIIMPNHIHLIIRITGGHGDPPLQNVIGGIKSYTTKIYGKTLWQRSFYDHIIRDEKDYMRICEYIENNPQKWAEDKYYI